MRKNETVTLIVKVFIFYITIIFSSSSFSGNQLEKNSEYQWQEGQLNTKRSIRIRTSELDPAVLSNILYDYNSAPYMMSMEPFKQPSKNSDTTEIYTIITLNDAWRNKDTNVVSMVYSIKYVKDIQLVYEIENNVIVGKYIDSFWD